MNVLDWVLVALAAGYALAGFRQGFLVGALATVGLLGGGAVGVAVAPLTLDRFDPSLGVSLLALLLVAAVVGQAVGSFAGAALRSAVSWQPARALDALGGAALSAAAVLVVAWALGVAVSAIRLPGVGTQVRSSAVLSLVDRTLPAETDRLLQSLADVVDTSVFPRYLEPFFPERIRPVRPPSAAVLRDQDVVQARHSVVRVLGSSEACGTLQGSGFVYAPERVMTNAHVVAGIVEPEVEVAGRRFPAVPVVYDPDVDLAVLAVEGLPTPACGSAAAVGRARLRRCSGFRRAGRSPASRPGSATGRRCAARTSTARGS